MLRRCIKIFSLAAVFAIIVAVVVSSAYIPTNRDTRKPPDTAVYKIEKTDEYELLGKFGSLEYYFREDRDIILVKNTQTGETWKTGLDAPFGTQLADLIEAAETLEEKIKIAEPREERLNSTYTAMANSLLTVEFYDDAFNINMTSSAAAKGAHSQLMTVEDGHYRLDVDFFDISVQVKLHVFLTERGISYKVYDDEITGLGVNKMASVIITPFLGASGGAVRLWDAETGEYAEESVFKPMLPSYAFVPDGSGALIRFNDNTVSLKKYTGSVYGVNPAEDTYYHSENSQDVAAKSPLMPVFGIARGQEQSAFVAWADDGAEHMEIIMSPEETMTYYNYLYPRFVYNKQIHQVYNRKGEGFFRLYPERLHFDVSMEYRFLEGQSADYVGMALEYRQHLIKNGTLIENKVAKDGNMPIRVDFVMSDVKKSVIGRANVVTTNTKQVRGIIDDLANNGITNVNGGLLGFQKGGITTGKPWTFDFISSIGGKNDFKKLFAETDLSAAQDYATINKLQMTLSRNQAYHVNRWGVTSNIANETFLPVNDVSYARPSKSADWFSQQTKKAINLGAKSVTASGITNLLTSHWGTNSETAEDAIKMYENAFAETAKNAKINAETPNMYLWKYTDRFLQTPVLTTQYILETDTVPFLQLILNGTMEMYAPYSNFSFYTQSDILRMIDYNVYPSFVVTKEPAHLLSATNSLVYYSTEYNVYKDIIKSVYDEVSSVLGKVKGLEWIDRRVLDDGVILNTYRDGTKILINYTADSYTYENNVAPANKAIVIN